jgi:two-component system sensor histidine kinase KdpD
VVADCRLCQAQGRDELAGADRPLASCEDADDLHPCGVGQSLEQPRRRLGLIVVEALAPQRQAAVDHVERLHIDVYRNDVRRYVKATYPRRVNAALQRAPARIVLSVAALALVTGLIFALDQVAPVLSLGVLYVFAVLPVAIVGGLPYAVPVAIASMLAFNFFFLPPRHSLQLTESENWVTLGVYLVTAVVVSELAVRSRRRAAEAEQRAREAALLAEVSAALLESEQVQSELRGIGMRVGRVLGASRGSIELGSLRQPDAGESAYELRAGDRHVGRLFLPNDADPDPEVTGRVLGALASLLAVAVDRERLARRALETEALRRSDETKTTILRAVSHDLRTPLTAIRASTDGLTTPSLELDADDRAALLATIAAEAKRLERLVGNLLELSRLEVGAAAPRLELWTIEDLVGRALAGLGAAAERVSVSIPDELPPICVDGTQIERVLVNLLENALKFSSPTDPVSLSAEHADGDVIVRVLDAGPGLAEQDRERVFEPFERGAEAGARTGAGLGLAIARGFTHANGGRVWAEAADSGGTSFVVALPAAAARGTRSPA